MPLKENCIYSRTARLVHASRRKRKAKNLKEAICLMLQCTVFSIEVKFSKKEEKYNKKVYQKEMLNLCVIASSHWLTEIEDNNQHNNDFPNAAKTIIICPSSLTAFPIIKILSSFSANMSRMLLLRLHARTIQHRASHNILILSLPPSKDFFFVPCQRFNSCEYLLWHVLEGWTLIG